jgi:uncharacterized membrane protein
MTNLAVANKTKQWKLTRNCAMRPCDVALQVLVIAALNGVIGAVFWSLGYPGVMVFCVIEMLFIAGATLVYARHAVDGERVQLDSEALHIETVEGGDLRIYSLHPAWVWLERGEGCALTLRSGRLRVPVGGHVSDVQRLRFVDEFSATLAAARAGHMAPPAHEPGTSLAARQAASHSVTTP